MAKNRVTDQDLTDALASGTAGRFTSAEGETRMREWVRAQQDNGRDLKTAANAIGLYALSAIGHGAALRGKTTS